METEGEQLPEVRCSLCGAEIAAGERYWRINGLTLCGRCLTEYARADYTAFSRVRGREESF